MVPPFLAISYTEAFRNDSTSVPAKIMLKQTIQNPFITDIQHDRDVIDVICVHQGTVLGRWQRGLKMCMRVHPRTPAAI